MNWYRGLFRLWLVLSLSWIGRDVYTAWLRCPDDMPCLWGISWGVPPFWYVKMWMLHALTLRLTALVLGLVCIWLLRGFRANRQQQQ